MALKVNQGKFVPAPGTLPIQQSPVPAEQVSAAAQKLIQASALIDQAGDVMRRMGMLGEWRILDDAGRTVETMKSVLGNKANMIRQGRGI